MECSCIRGTDGFRFYLETLDPKTLIYQDQSDWMSGEGNTIPNEYTLSILPPGKGAPIEITIKTGSHNKITSSDLGYIGTLKDGLYCFEVTSCGTKYKAVRGVLPNIECCIRSAYATGREDYFAKLKEIELYLSMFKNDAELQMIQSAQNTLDIAKELLTNIKCDCKYKL